MKTLAAILLLLVLPGCAAVAQDEPDSIITRRTVIAGQYEGSLWPPVKTDKQGNVYVRLHATDAPIDSTLLKISRDGLRVTRFSSSSVPDAVTTFLDFAPSPSGELYTLHECARLRGEPPCYMIARFNALGRYVNSVRVENWLIPSNIAAFDNGGFLLVVRDYRSGTRDTEPAKTPAIFDKDGNWVRNIRLADTPAAFDRPARTSERGEVLDALTTQSADDGSVYVTRFSPSPAVFVISAAGDVTEYDLPDLRRAAATLRSAVIGKGKLLVLYDTYQDDPGSRDESYSVGSVCQVFDLALRMRLPGFRTGGYGTLAATDGNSVLYISSAGQGRYELRWASIP
jgi:hypothetical protein